MFLVENLISNFFCCNCINSSIGLLKDNIMFSLNMIWLFVYTALCVLLLNAVLIPLTVVVARGYFRRKRAKQKAVCDALSVAFFHPYCNAGGGGERVLWCAIRALQKSQSDVKVVVYTGDLTASPPEILARVLSRFDIKLEPTLQLVYLRSRAWLDPVNYPHFTLLRQSLGSLVVGLEALLGFLPDIYLDSMGYAFTLPLFSYVGDCSVGCYVHYPTITTDMLHKVASRRSAHNNPSFVATSPFLSSAKILYYRIFAWMYSVCGQFPELVMVNSSWTEEHINSLWKRPLSVHRLYPPCDISAFRALPLAPDFGEGGPIRIVSVGQFRPEKDHPLQLKAMYELRQLLTEPLWERVKLTLVGSCRDQEDELRVRDMKDLCRHLSLESNVEFRVNLSFEELKVELGSSTIGLHAMWNEHFGIGVVECMAAGHIMVAHKSGGPKADIIEEAEGSRNGFLASDEVEYGRAVAAIIRLTPAARLRIREAARSSVDRFSTEEFEKGFLRTMEPLLSQPSKYN